MFESAAELPPKTAVFLMAHGAPDNVGDIPAYLNNIREDLGRTPEIVREVQSRYQAIGGSSPMLEITRGQAAELQKFLNQDKSRNLRVYFGMRNWRPYIRDVVQVALEDGVTRFIALCLAPQYSLLSTELYFNALKEALKENSAEVEVRYIPGWCNHPLLIDAWEEKYNEAAERLRQMGEENFFTIFTVHSIPKESIDDGDPYLDEYDKTVDALIDRVRPRRWFKAFQSQGKRPVPWVGPSVEEALDRVARKGSKPVLIFPVGFVSDHIEILYDIDIGFKRYAEARKLRLYRTESLNLSPALTEALASVVWENLI